MNFDLSRRFDKCCITGELEEAKKIFPLIKDEVSSSHLFLSCDNNHLEFSKWLFSLLTLNSDDLYSIFMSILAKNQKVDIFKWLYELKDFPRNKTHLFLEAACHYNLEVAKFLNSVKPIKEGDIAFYCFAARDKETRDWLNSLY